MSDSSNVVQFSEQASNAAPESKDESNVQMPVLKKKKNLLKNEDRAAIVAMMFLLPFLIGFGILKLAPFIVSLKLSFSTIANDYVYNMQWVGWYNYSYLLSQSTKYSSAVLSTITSTLIELPVINISAFFFAILLNRDIKGKAFFRAVFFLPVILGTGIVMNNITGSSTANGDSVVTGATNAMDMITSGIKLPEELLMYFGEGVMPIVTSFFQVLTTTLWKTGVQVLLFLTGLQGISGSLYESAYCDGASQWEMFWKITLPMMTPTILLSLIYTLIARFTDASNPLSKYFLGESGDEVMSVLGDGGKAAVAWMYTAISLVFIGLVFLIMKPIIKKTSTQK